MLKVSVIIPVYNTARYLPKCLDCLIGQSLKEIEIICVNDGSSDESLEILKRYEKLDERVLLINKENTGAADSRNKGLDVAKGQYVCFVDSDDWVDTDFLELLYQKACDENLDWVKAGVFVVRQNGRRVLSCLNQNTQTLLNDGKSVVCGVVSEWWSILYKRSIIESYHLRFANFKLGEDSLFLTEYLCCAHKFAILDKPCYYYFQRSTSLVHSIKRDDWKDVFVTTQRILELFEKNHVDKNSIVYYLKNKIRYFGGFYSFVKETSEENSYVAAFLWLSAYLRRLDDSLELALIKDARDLERYFATRKLTFLQRVFSVKNSENKEYKIITVLGIKIKLKRKNYKL